MVHESVAVGELGAPCAAAHLRCAHRRGVCGRERHAPGLTALLCATRRVVGPCDRTQGHRGEGGGFTHPPVARDERVGRSASGDWQQVVDQNRVTCRSRIAVRIRHMYRYPFEREHSEVTWRGEGFRSCVHICRGTLRTEGASRPS